jgi:hypothetical protein
MGEIYLVSSTKSISLSKDRGSLRQEATSNHTHSVKSRRERSSAVDTKTTKAIEGREERSTFFVVSFDRFVLFVLAQW